MYLLVSLVTATRNYTYVIAIVADRLVAWFKLSLKLSSRLTPCGSLSEPNIP
jgi:hypothetical protein